MKNRLEGIIPQEDLGIERVKRVLEKFFPKGTEINRELYMTNEYYKGQFNGNCNYKDGKFHHWYCYRFKTPELEEYVLWRRSQHFTDSFITTSKKINGQTIRPDIVFSALLGNELTPSSAAFTVFKGSRYLNWKPTENSMESGRVKFSTEVIQIGDAYRVIASLRAYKKLRSSPEIEKATKKTEKARRKLSETMREEENLAKRVLFGE